MSVNTPADGAAPTVKALLETQSNKDIKESQRILRDADSMPNGAIAEDVESAAREVVDAAFQVHISLGPGLLESAYEDCLCHELTIRRVRHERQRVVPITYKGKRIEAGFRADLIVEDELIVELKAVDAMLPIHSAQLFTYLKLTNKRLGLLINFNVPLIKDGIRRIVC